MTVSLDTDIAIEILRWKNQLISSKWSALAASGTVVLYSPVVAAELWAGALPHEHRLISVFFHSLICIATDYEIGELAGALLRKFAKSHSLEIPDAPIAATAIQHKTALWTRNRYPMPELTY